MGRTKLGYFVGPLTEEEKSLIYPSYNSFNEIIFQKSLYCKLMADVTSTWKEKIKGEVIPDEIANYHLQQPLENWKRELLSIERCDIPRLLKDPELFIKYDSSVDGGGKIILGKVILDLEEGISPYRFDTQVRDSTGESLVRFANNNIDDFNTKENQSELRTANSLLSKYIEDRIKDDALGNRPELDHSEIITKIVEIMDGG